MVAVALPHGQFLVIGLFFLILGLILIGVARFWPSVGGPVVTSVAMAVVAPVARTIAPEPAAEQTGAVAALTHRLDWPTLIDPDAGYLDEGERRRIIDGLGLVGEPWCTEILVKAFEQEDDELRVAAIESLAQSQGDAVSPTLERAYASHVIAERYAAIDGASRRSDVPLLERGVRDTDATVALAAAYGLYRAGRRDLLTGALEDRDDARAAEIRRILPMLEA